MTPPSLAQRAIAEAIGTFFLVLVGPGAVMVDAYTQGGLGVTGIALAFGFVVCGMIYALGHLSGAHINPAVSIAFWSRGRLAARDLVAYVIAQCAGAVLASAVLRYVLGPVGALGATLPNVGTGRTFLIEFLFSFGLMLVIMAVATDSRAVGPMAGVAIGLTVGFCALLGPMTGSSMNPARSLGPAVAGGGWAGHWIYWLAPIAGTVSAAAVYERLRGALPQEVLQ